jgi:hypothetical protein
VGLLMEASHPQVSALSLEVGVGADFPSPHQELFHCYCLPCLITMVDVT